MVVSRLRWLVLPYAWWKKHMKIMLGNQMEQLFKILAATLEVVLGLHHEWTTTTIYVAS